MYVTLYYPFSVTFEQWLMWTDKTAIAIECCMVVRFEWLLESAGASQRLPEVQCLLISNMEDNKGGEEVDEEASQQEDAELEEETYENIGPEDTNTGEADTDTFWPPGYGADSRQTWRGPGGGK